MWWGDSLDMVMVDVKQEVWGGDRRETCENSGVREDSCESLGLQGDQNSQS